MKILKLEEEIRKCKKCSLYKLRIKAVPGEGPENAVIMFCGQAPGRTEDKEGRPFIGRAGKLLNALLKSVKLCRNKVFITSSIKCFPPNNRPPKREEIRKCKFYLMEQIKIVNPKIIVTLGNCALRTLLDNNKITISKIHGKPQKINKKIIFPTFHPAAAIRFPRIKDLLKKDFQKLKKLIKKQNISI